MKREQKANVQKYLIVGGIVASVLLIFSIVLVSVLQSNQKSTKKTYQPEIVPTDSVGTTDNETYTTAVFMSADTVNKHIFVCDVLTGEQLMFDYSGGTDITDKYGQLITASQLVKGQIVKLNYITNTNRLTKLALSADIWENIGVTDVIINKEARIISYLGKNYSYQEGTVFLSDGSVINVEDLLSIDYLTIRGWEENIYSVVVTGGHGYIELTGQEQFLGGKISVGTQLTEDITEPMHVAVREGTYNVTVTNKKLEGNKEVVISRNQTTVCDVSEFALAELEEGNIIFHIEPEGAKLTIDGEEVNYIGVVPLSVGEHNIEVSLGGYRTYTGTLNVSKGSMSTSITLQSNETVVDENVTPTIEPSNDNNNSYGNDDNTSENIDDSTPTPTPVEEDDTYDEPDDEEDPDEYVDEDDDNIIDDDEAADPTPIPSGTDASKTITIKWTTGAEVYFNGEYVGTIKNGTLTVPKQYGEIDVDLIVGNDDAVTYKISVENDGKNAVFQFPE